MGQDSADRKKQYIAAAIVIAVVVSATAILIAFTQQQEEGVLINTNPLMQRPGSSTPTGPAQTSSQPEGQPEGQSGGTGPEMTVSPTTTSAASRIEMQGSGFEPIERVMVAIDNAPLDTEPAPVFTDEEGSFSAQATVPAVPPGKHEITATGDKGTAVTRSITVS
ncbi:MAG: hypothetical protein QXJ74_03980 [Nitrososphaera sp.]|uniref:hypothetical protein n=1 Tax=Nitrososphaera sp. TaxID=1971748 RepID=UPI00317B2404